MDCENCRNKNHKSFNREIWTISDNKDELYKNIRQSLREMDVLRPAKSNKKYF